MWREDILIRLYSRVYSRPRCVRALRFVGAASVLYVALAFAFACILIGEGEGSVALLKFVTVAAIPFILVSAVRVIINCERPYELIDFPPFGQMRKERKAGRSFPSRHVFSAFLIGVLLFEVSPLVGALTVAVGVFIALQRVMLGIHFPKDTVVGAIIGLVSGIVGIAIL